MDLSLLHPRRPFPHPYRPYAIQNDFMLNLYTAIQRRQVAILESPTGTVRPLTKDNFRFPCIGTAPLTSAAT